MSSAFFNVTTPTYLRNQTPGTDSIESQHADIAVLGHIHWSMFAQKTLFSTKPTFCSTQMFHSQTSHVALKKDQPSQ